MLPWRGFSDNVGNTMGQVHNILYIGTHFNVLLETVLWLTLLLNIIIVFPFTVFILIKHKQLSRDFLVKVVTHYIKMNVPEFKFSCVS